MVMVECEENVSFWTWRQKKRNKKKLSVHGIGHPRSKSSVSEVRIGYIHAAKEKIEKWNEAKNVKVMRTASELFLFVLI